MTRIIVKMDNKEPAPLIGCRLLLQGKPALLDLGFQMRLSYAPLRPLSITV